MGKNQKDRTNPKMLDMLDKNIKKGTFSFRASNSCRVVPPAVMDVWDHYCHPTPFQEAMIHVPACTSCEMAPTSAVHVWKKELDSVKYMRALVCCQCVFPRLRVRLTYTHGAGICFISICVWLIKNTDTAVTWRLFISWCSDLPWPFLINSLNAEDIWILLFY